MKICSMCKIEKNILDFCKNITRKDGFSNNCRTCMSSYHKRPSRREYEKNRSTFFHRKVKQAAYNSSNRRKELELIRNVKYPDKVAAKAAKRRASKYNATPKWLTKEQLLEIKEFYTLCKDLQWLSDFNDPLQVDHIVPLQGENICGLHVPWNLQILPRSLNIKKGNKIGI